jgi:dTDP-4-amino-4,6-dideoxygalactose transaminase
MEVPLLDLKAQYATIREQIRAAVDDVFESQRFILGTHVAALEEETARHCGVPSAVGVASGTDALLLSLKALGVGPGDAVVTVPYTFFATAGTIVNLGARPVFVDIEPAGFNMDPERLLGLLERDCSFNPKTRSLAHKPSGAAIKAIVPIHLYGQCAAMDEILSIARKYQLPVVEDACQAFGARYRDDCAGAMGDLGCFSFFPSKNLGGVGDGGMVVTRNERLAKLVRLLRNHGMQPKYFHAFVGFNSRLDEIQAAVLRVKLTHLEDWNEARRRNAADYDALFLNAGLSGKVKTPAVLPHRRHIFHQYVIRCQKRDMVRAALQSRGVGSEIYYPLSLHEQECFSSLGYGTADLPRSSEAAAETLALPIYAELTHEQRAYVVSCIADFYA